MRKRRYKALMDRISANETEIERLCDRVAHLALSIAELKNDETDILFGFSADIDELKSALNDYGELAKEQHEAYVEQVRKDIGFQNMMNY